MSEQIPKLSSAAAAEVFRTADVARVLGVPPVRVRAIVRAGLCRPARRGRALQFSFQDLVLLRAAHGLLQADIPARRLRRALTELARQLPAARPVTGVRIYADGKHIVVRDGRTAWRPDSGQVVFSFELEELARVAHQFSAPNRRSRPAPVKPKRPQQAAVWFERALMLEKKNDPAGAAAAYQQVIELDAEMGDAYVNLGRLVHEQGDAIEAARLYHLALECMPDDAVAHYNLAIALEDQRHVSAALSHYQQATTLDPEFADAHFNLGRLLERLGRRAQAVRHLLAYKKLTESK